MTEHVAAALTGSSVLLHGSLLVALACVIPAERVHRRTPTPRHHVDQNTVKEPA